MKESIKKRVEALTNGSEGEQLNPLEELQVLRGTSKLSKSEILRRTGKKSPLRVLMEMREKRKEGKK